MRKKKPGSLADLHNYFMKAEAGKKLTPEGNGHWVQGKPLKRGIAGVV